MAHENVAADCRSAARTSYADTTVGLGDLIRTQIINVRRLNTAFSLKNKGY